MGMLDRYKKKGGFLQLLTLIETSGKQKQEQFLALILQENAVWEAELRKKSLTLDKILSWDVSHLSEVLSRVQPLTLATALSGMPKERVELILGCLGISDRRKIQTVIDESKPTPAEINTCVMKIITETRGFMTTGILKMDKIDPELAIPENIEEQLNTAAIQKSLNDLTPASSGTTTEVSSETGLVFELRSNRGENKHDDKNEAKSEHSREEIDFLKKKVNTLVAENTSLKQEVAVLRGKLEQIKKIA